MSESKDGEVVKEMIATSDRASEAINIPGTFLSLTDLYTIYRTRRFPTKEVEQIKL